MKKIHIISLGCSKNLVDSEVMLGRLREYEMTQDIGSADVIIINTCGFIEAAKKESLSHIFNALNARKKGALLVASGCLVARYAKEIKEMIPEIDILSGVGDFDKIDSMINNQNSLMSEKVFLQDSQRRVISGSNIHAFVKISEGCNQSCSFCAIPSFKGKLQSRSIDSILREIENLAEQGYRDISLIAQDSSSYLMDRGIKDGLLKLINAIDAQGVISSARILYLYPSSTDVSLLFGIANSKIFQNYYDMPIQHISKSVLKSMQRSYSDVRILLENMKKIPNSFIRSSIIVGYPNESDRDFEELCEFLESFKFDRLNVFEYSKEEGTKAFSLQEIPKNIRTKRINAVKKILSRNEKALYKSMINSTIECIVEGRSSSSPYFFSARDKRWGFGIDGEILINDVGDSEDFNPLGYYNVRVNEAKDGILVGSIV